MKLIKNIFLWIAVIAMPVVCFLFANIMLNALYFLLENIGLNNFDFLEFYNAIIPSILMAIIFFLGTFLSIYWGTKIAPSYHKITMFFLASFSILIAIPLLKNLISEDGFYPYLPTITAVVLGAVIGIKVASRFQLKMTETEIIK